MKITILSVGKIKEKFLQDAIKEFEKRLSRYTKLEIQQVADEKTIEGSSEVSQELIRKREGERLLKHVREDDFVVTLEIQGVMLSSEEFAEQIKQWSVRGVRHVVFVIGGSLGLSKEVRQRSNYALSFSKMTFPHQLMRVILLEQIYRSYRIIQGEPYHK